VLHPSLRSCWFSQDLCCSSVTSWVTFVGGKRQVFTVLMTFSMWLPATTFQGPARVVMSQKKRLNTVTFIMFPAISETLGCTAVVCCKHEFKKKRVCGYHLSYKRCGVYYNCRSRSSVYTPLRENTAGPHGRCDHFLCYC